MPWFTPTYNAAPQSIQPVIRLNRDSCRREAALLRWGLVPFWAKDAKTGYSTINARAEAAATMPAYREALKKRRCLVPADAFYSLGSCTNLHIQICPRKRRFQRDH
jgi:putative SOS response-associated peptidase YedK